MEIVSVSVLSKVLSLDCHVHKFGIQSKRKTEKKRKSGRPAKLKEKKGDRDLEREIKTKETFFCWKNNMKIL